MSLATPIERICRLAADFRGSGKSMVQLVRESGIGNPAIDLTAAAALPVLEQDPSLIDSWLLWSMNKRVSSGWYFQQEGANFVVALFPNGERLVFQHKASACATFIVKEVGAVYARSALQQVIKADVP